MSTSVNLGSTKGLAAVFAATGGSGVDPLETHDVLGLDYIEPNASFLENFNTPYTGANGDGPILNANANLLPTRADQYRDTASFADYKLGNGLGVARPYRKPDSLGGQTPEGFQGAPMPTKMFGRDAKSYDLNFVRADMQERANMALKKMGQKPNEVPQYADYFPWQWNDTNAIGTSGAPIGNSNQYNRHYGVPDADAVARRGHTPAPSRLTQMLTTDIELAALTPNRTLMHPLKVVTEDRQREKMQRISRNTDVIEAVTYQNIMPRGNTSKVEAPRVYAETDVLRQPIGTNDTGDRSVHGRWNNQEANIVGDPLLAATLEDKLQLFKDSYRILEGKDPSYEENQYVKNQLQLLEQSQTVSDYNHINPRPGEFPHDASGTSTPLRMPPQVGHGSGF